MSRTLSSPRSPQLSPSKSHGGGEKAGRLHVGPGLRLEGKIESCETLTVEGNVRASIESGSLNVSRSGSVTGEAQVDTAQIDGMFEGTLTVRDCLTVNATGHVSGIINYGDLVIEKGGRVIGEIRNAPRPDAAAQAERKQRPDPARPAQAQAAQPAQPAQPAQAAQAGAVPRPAPQAATAQARPATG